MKYTRPKFAEPGFPVFKTNSSFGNVPITMPKFDTPITPKENFLRAARRNNPLWVPNHMTDMQEFQFNELGTHKPGNFQGGPDFRGAQKNDYTFIDPYGSSWTWVASAQGAMLTPGSKAVVDDITKWEKQVRWPVLDEWTYKEVADKFMAEEYDPSKALHINIFQGCTEILVSLLGGYGEAMLAMAEEPEAAADFCEFFADHMIEFYDYMKKLYPIDFVTYHDDWGTERATFFSPEMMADIVYNPTKRIVDHIKADGVVFELHSCGNIERFIPYMCDMGIDFLQIQRRAVDIPKLKAEYGDKIGFNPMPEDYIPGEPYTEEQMIEIVRKTVDTYAKGGGFYPWLFETEPRALWTLCTEMYCYSREFYDKEQGR